jgi:hypothetical protein
VPLRFSSKYLRDRGGLLLEYLRKVDCFREEETFRQVANSRVGIGSPSDDQLCSKECGKKREHYMDYSGRMRGLYVPWSGRSLARVRTRPRHSATNYLSLVTGFDKGDT